MINPNVLNVILNDPNRFNLAQAYVLICPEVGSLSKGIDKLEIEVQACEWFPTAIYDENWIAIADEIHRLMKNKIVDYLSN